VASVWVIEAVPALTLTRESIYQYGAYVPPASLGETCRGGACSGPAPGHARVKLRPPGARARHPRARFSGPDKR